MTTDAQSEERLLYRSEVAVSLGGGPNKLVHFPGGDEPVVMGAGGELAGFLGVDTARFPARTSTLDFLVGATAACLTGTLGRALTARGIPVTGDDLDVRAVGDVVVDDGVPVLRRIHVTYKLTGHAGKREEAVRAHRVHHRGCAVSRSLEGSVEITSELELA